MAEARSAARIAARYSGGLLEVGIEDVVGARHARERAAQLGAAACFGVDDVVVTMRQMPARRRAPSLRRRRRADRGRATGLRAARVAGALQLILLGEGDTDTNRVLDGSRPAAALDGSGARRR